MVEYILKDNLLLALRKAIQAQETYEKEHYGEHFESALIAGWRQVADAIEAGKPITIRD